MKTFTISTFLFLLATGLHAAPSNKARQFEAQLTFEGAPPDVAFYTLSVPTDGSVFQICTSPADSPFPTVNVPSRLLVPIDIFETISPESCAYLTYTIPDNPLSVSHIASQGGATCTLFGVDGSVTTVVGANTVDVGPPQTQVSGTCRAL